MANSTLTLLIFAFTFISPIITIYCTSSSFSASEQMRYWSENVDNKMPTSLITKLSPMTKNETEFFSLSLTNHSIPSNADFCTIANLACVSRLSKILPAKSNLYNTLPASLEQTKVMPSGTQNYYNIPASSESTQVMPSGSQNYYNIPASSESTKVMSSGTQNYYNIPASSESTKVIMPSINKINYNNPASSESTNIDTSSFFRLSILKHGEKVHLTTLQNQFPERAFLPSEIASKISITRVDLQAIFPESLSSPQTKEAIDTTLIYCNAASLKGESKSCLTSLEQMIEFSKTTLGAKHLVSLTTKSTKGSGKELMIGNVKRIKADKVVSCHEIFLPFATYYCHLLSSTRLYAVQVLDSETNFSINTVLATCHMDTSEWPKNHVAFKILKFAPGEGEACHWMTQIDLSWVASG